jgi:hypothetical protein
MRPRPANRQKVTAELDVTSKQLAELTAERSNDYGDLLKIAKMKERPEAAFVLKDEGEVSRATCAICPTPRTTTGVAASHIGNWKRHRRTQWKAVSHD